MKFKYSKASIMMTTLLLLAGCGGGGGDWVEVSTPAAVSDSSIKGFWGDAQKTTSAIVLANGDTWVVFQNANKVITSFARLQTQASDTSYSSTGNQYSLQTGTSETAIAAGSFFSKATISVKMATANNSSDLNLAYNTRYETVAQPEDAVGSWTGTFGGSSGSRTINIAATGILTGNSTTGCNYAGTLLPRSADPAVFDVNFTETCVAGVSKSLSGIATVNEAKTALFITATTDDKASGALFVGQK